MTAHPLNNYQNAIGRWAGLGPYYAMFPTNFAFQVIEEYSKPGDTVLDPFAGRASSVYAAAVTRREAIGVEINPVGWLYGHVKLDPATKNSVLKRTEEIGRIATTATHEEQAKLPEFFRHCYAPRVLNYLLFARDLLQWQTRKTDATLMGLLLVNLHGKRSGSLSNQMRQGKAMSPEYSVAWWQAHQSAPPDIDPVIFLKKRIEWRYAKGRPPNTVGRIILGDSTKVMPRLANKVAQGKQRRCSLLFTSPPYCDITNYHYDQWLRLWMLGGPARALNSGKDWQGRFTCKDAYRNLLQQVFSESARVMKRNATIYIRTDARPFTYEATQKVLTEVFPRKTIKEIRRPFLRSTQTALFGDDEDKPGEVDLVLQAS